jgi:chromosome segregation ATPase
LRNLKTDADVQKLAGQLEAIANKAIAPEQNGGKRGLEERRRAIADFLYNFDATAGWHARVQTVVGLEHYVGAADRQYGNLRDMAQRLRGIIADEQAAFVREYQAEIPKLQGLAEQLKAVQAKLTEQQELVQRLTVQRNARQTEAAEYQTQIATARQKVADETAKLHGLQKQLFDLQQEFAKAQATNERLEQELRGRETTK